MTEYIVRAQDLESGLIICGTHVQGEIVRCRDCEFYEPEQEWIEGRGEWEYEPCGEPPTCTLGYALSSIARDAHPEGYCAWGERRQS